ncbi:MAG TPA: hypothetical protein VK634_19725 [Reyranella sp.]|nr:hypothetical protein [Reyranella sp.]HTE82925.1 hypothetical protein [Reyranella sp.]
MTFTIRSWNNTAPEIVADYAAAVAIAKRRAAAEGSLVTLTNDGVEETCNVLPDGSLGKWQDTDRDFDRDEQGETS